MSKAAAPQLNPRDIIAKKYEVDSLLGVGAQGATYLARDMASGRKVALKMLAGPPASDEVAQSVLRRSQALVHDGIVRLTDTGMWEEPGTRTQFRWVTMDYIEGETLRRLMDSYAGQKQVFTVQEAAQILVKTLEAVASAHRPDGFIHRHLKPSNVMVQTRMVGGRPVRTVRVVGFGISDLVAEEVLQRASSTPYHARESHDVHGKSTTLDTYALGILFYELLCGQPPRGTYLPPSHVRDLGEAPLPKRIDAIVFVATNFSPEGRYPKAEDMLQDVQRAVTDLGGDDTGLSMNVIVGAVAAVVIAIGAIAGKLYVDDGKDKRADEALRSEVITATASSLPAKDVVEKRLAGHEGMVWVPAGEFVKGRMRSEAPEVVANYEPVANKAYVKGFYIDAFEWPNEKGGKAKVRVTSTEASEVCASQGKRLCSEDEWEKACKGPNNTIYGYDVAAGDPASLAAADVFDPAACGDLAVDADGDGNVERENGSGARCRSGYGVFDMSGGAREWTSTVGNDGPFLRTKGGKSGDAARASRCSFYVDQRADLPDAALSFRCCIDEDAPMSAGSAGGTPPVEGAAAPTAPATAPR